MLLLTYIVELFLRPGNWLHLVLGVCSSQFPYWQFIPIIGDRKIIVDISILCALLQVLFYFISVFLHQLSMLSISTNRNAFVNKSEDDIFK